MIEHRLGNHYPELVTNILPMKSKDKKTYTRPALLKHGLLSRLTLKTGSLPDGFTPTREI